MPDQPDAEAPEKRKLSRKAQIRELARKKKQRTEERVIDPEYVPQQDDMDVDKCDPGKVEQPGDAIRKQEVAYKKRRYRGQERLRGLGSGSQLMQGWLFTLPANQQLIVDRKNHSIITSEEVHYRPGHFWLAQAPDLLEVRRIEKRGTIEGVMFGISDYLVRIGRYFDRVASDTSGLTFEEWTPPDGSSFVINATELRGVNFTMKPTKPMPVLPQLRRSTRVGVVEAPTVPRAKEYVMDQLIDDTIRARCW